MEITSVQFLLICVALCALCWYIATASRVEADDLRIKTNDDKNGEKEDSWI